MLLLSVALASPPPANATRTQLLDHLRDEAIPAWFGTPWAFYGTSQQPGQGTIACGYFVSTVLQQAGFAVERVHLAQQPSEYIVKTFADERQLKRFRSGHAQSVVDWVLTQPDNVFSVGLDFHTGFLIKRGSSVEFCHSSYVGDRPYVQCNPAASDPGFASQYHIVGPVLTDHTLQKRRQGRPVRTYRP